MFAVNHISHLLFFFFAVSESVEIKNINVPAIYELKENPEPLILDCDYEMMPNESGFVLKWLHNKGKSLLST